jgi:hypothetical protein
MLFTVPIGRSFFGWGTVTLPFLVGCVNWWCDPTVLVSTQPSALSFLMIAVLFMMCKYTQLSALHKPTHELFS